MNQSVTIKINLRYVFVLAVAVVLTWLLHELAHWICGELMGYRMGMTLNSCYPLNGKYETESDYQLVSAAGPLFTLFEAGLVFILLMGKRRPLLLPFLFTCLYMRFFAMGISVLNPNDEARISTYLGIGKYTLPVLTTLVLLMMVLITNRRYRPGSRFLLSNLVLIILVSSLLILTDMYWRIRLI